MVFPTFLLLERLHSFSAKIRWGALFKSFPFVGENHAALTLCWLRPFVDSLHASYTWENVIYTGTINHLLNHRNMYLWQLYNNVIILFKLKKKPLPARSSIIFKWINCIIFCLKIQYSSIPLPKLYISNYKNGKNPNLDFSCMWNALSIFILVEFCMVLTYKNTDLWLPVHWQIVIPKFRLNQRLSVIINLILHIKKFVFILVNFLG